MVGLESGLLVNAFLLRQKKVKQTGRLWTRLPDRKLFSGPKIMFMFNEIRDGQK